MSEREKAAEVVEKITGVPWDVFSDAEWGWVDLIAEAIAAPTDFGVIRCPECHPLAEEAS